MSMRTMWDSSSNSSCANARASSVLPTPEVPRNMKLPTGRFGDASPARLLITAEATAATAWSWPMTRARRVSSRDRSFLDSASVSFSTGMPVHLATTAATCSAPTVSETAVLERLARSSKSASLRSCSGSTSNLRSATFSVLNFISLMAIAHCVSSISFFTAWILFTMSLPASNSACSSACRSFQLSRSSVTTLRRVASLASLARANTSLAKAARSTSSCCTLRLAPSSSGGRESSCTRTSAHASSMRSIALSGIFLPLRYRAASCAAATTPASKMRTPWWVS
mmetsp:Transcript_18964/g.51011  ORF Transcript_18964/g.51011 Transcript_18964/m.51011 type:complete len:283 (-) Transcript_18964:548-1396(-)